MNFPIRYFRIGTKHFIRDTDYFIQKDKDEGEWDLFKNQAGNYRWICTLSGTDLTEAKNSLEEIAKLFGVK